MTNTTIRRNTQKGKAADNKATVEHVFLLDSTTAYLYENQPNTRLFLSEKDFTNDFTKLKEGIRTLTILAELDWTGRPMQTFYGFEIARRLRLEEALCCPIYLISVFGRQYFNAMPEHLTRYQILNGRGTHLISLAQVSLKEDHYTDPDPLLSLAVVYDMNEMLLQDRGFVSDKLTHDLFYNMEPASFHKVMNDAAKTIHIWQKSEIGWDGFCKDLFENLNKSKEFNDIKESLLLRIEEVIPAEAKQQKLSNEVKHSLLVVEDNMEFRANIVFFLANHFKHIYATNDAKKAIEHINADTDNLITAILADWRLYYPDGKSWQQQGYEILEHAAKTKIMGLFALTSLKDRNIHNIRNVLGFDVHLFKKQHLQDAGLAQWNQMADTINQKCDSIIDIISGMPTGKRWLLNYYDKDKNTRVFVQPLKYKYIDLRNKNWELHSKMINDESDKIWDYYAPQVLSTNLQHCGISKINEKFGVEVGANDPNINHILIGRRIFFALWFNADNIEQTFKRKIWKNIDHLDFEIIYDENPLVKIYCVFTGDDCEHYCQTYKSTKADRAKYPTLLDSEIAPYKLMQNANTLSSNLCIQKEDFPAGILPEEKAWLSRHDIDYSVNKTVDYKTYPEYQNKSVEKIKLVRPPISKEPTDEQIRAAQKFIPQKYRE